MNKYEGMVIFPESVTDTTLEEAIKNTSAEIEKLKGVISNVTRLGKRQFARPLGKQESGHYAVVHFELAPDQITPLLARFKLNESVYRVQITRAIEAPATADASKTEEGVADGVAK